MLNHLNHLTHLPRPVSTAEIRRNIKSCAPHQHDTTSTIGAILTGAACLVACWFLYWPVARAAAWSLLAILKCLGILHADLPVYTPYPHDV